MYGMSQTGPFEAIVLGLSERSERHQAAIARLAECALGEPDLDVVLQTACEECLSLLDIEEARILVYQEEANGLTLRCRARQPQPSPALPVWHAAAPPAGASAVPAGLGLVPGTMFPAGLRAMTSLPIGSADDPFGVLELHRPYAREFSELEVNFISAVARLLGRAVERDRELEAMRLANDELAAQADEARTLLRELCHRVRNDLQGLEGQTHLLARHTSDPVARSGVQALGRRLMSLANLYEHLLARPDQQRIAFDAYLSTLCVRLQDAHDLTARGLTLELHAEPVHLPLPNAVGFGIVANELIANAVEHAFTDQPDDQPTGRGHNGRVRVTVAPEANQPHVARLTIADDGNGLRSGCAQGEGLRLAHRLTTHHGGKLACETGNQGTTWHLVFPCL